MNEMFENANLWVSCNDPQARRSERQYYVSDFANADALRDRIESEFGLPLELLRVEYDGIPKEYRREGFIVPEFWQLGDYMNEE